MYAKLTTLVNQLVNFTNFQKCGYESILKRQVFFILFITHCSVFEIKFFFFKKQKHFEFFSKTQNLRFFQCSKLFKSWNWSFLYNSLNFQNTLQCLLWKEQANNWHYHTLVLSIYLCLFNALTIHSIFGVDIIIIWSYADMITHYGDRIKHCIIMLS
jgi:hypothetical protein